MLRHQQISQFYLSLCLHGVVVMSIICQCTLCSPNCSDVTKLQKERFKFKVKDKDHTIGVVKVPVTSLTTASQTAWFPLQPHKRSSEAQGELQVEYWLSAPFKTEEEEEASNSTAAVENVTESGQVGTSLKDYFKRSMPGPQQQKGTKEEDLIHTLRRTAQHSSDSELHVFHRPPSPSKGSATPDLSSRSSSERRRVSFSPQGSSLRFSWRSYSPPSGSMPSSQPNLPEEGGGTKNNVPEVTGISPREASLEGGQRITLRGSNLGLSLEDVVKVTVVDMDCTDSVEYVSSGMGERARGREGEGRRERGRGICVASTHVSTLALLDGPILSDSHSRLSS